MGGKLRVKVSESCRQELKPWGALRPLEKVVGRRCPGVPRILATARVMPLGEQADDFQTRVRKYSDLQSTPRAISELVHRRPATFF